MTAPCHDTGSSALRPHLSFSVEGLGPRDEVLFKSLVRLLSHRTLHDWFQPTEKNLEQVDLRVVCDRLTATIRPLPAPQFQAVLTLSATDKTLPAVLHLPVRADALESELNRLGQLIETTRRHLARLAAMPRAAVEPPAVAISDRPFKLSRWPTSHLLNSPARLRIAALLVGKPVTLAELAEKTGQPLVLCLEFVNELRLSNFLADGGVALQGSGAAGQAVSVSVSAPPAPVRCAAVVQRGLLSRIRSRLGL